MTSPPERFGLPRRAHGPRGRTRPRRVRDEDGDAPAPRGQPAAALRRDSPAGCSTRSGCRTRESTPSSRTACRVSPRSASRSGSRRADSARRTTVVCAASTAATTSRRRTEPLVPERGGGARDGGGARRGGARGDAKPLYAKLSPATWDVAESARAVAAAGADGLSLINTIRGLALGAARRPALGRGAGGYSGPALRPSRSRASSRARPRSTSRSSGWAACPSGADVLDLVAAGATRSRSAPSSSPIRGPHGGSARSFESPGPVRRGTGRPGAIPSHRGDVRKSDNRKTPANRPKRFCLTNRASLVDSSGSWSRRSRTHRRLRGHSTRGWRRCSGRTTSVCDARSSSAT